MLLVLHILVFLGVGIPCINLHFMINVPALLGRHLDSVQSMNRQVALSQLVESSRNLRFSWLSRAVPDLSEARVLASEDGVMFVEEFCHLVKLVLDCSFAGSNEFGFLLFVRKVG